MLHGQGQVFGWREHFVKKETVGASGFVSKASCELSDTQ
jgi:hypothetical protein